MQPKTETAGAPREGNRPQISALGQAQSNCNPVDLILSRLEGCAPVALLGTSAALAHYWRTSADCLAGFAAAPEPRGGRYFRGATREECDALLFAIWMGTESALKATSRTKVSVVRILSELTGVSMAQLAKLWGSRINVQSRS